MVVGIGTRREVGRGVRVGGWGRGGVGGVGAELRHPTTVLGRPPLLAAGCLIGAEELVPTDGPDPHSERELGELLGPERGMFGTSPTLVFFPESFLSTIWSS